MKLTRIAVLLSLLPALAGAQQKVIHRHGEPLPSTLQFELPAGAAEVSIPFQIANHHLLLPARVNGQGPFQVILDTGMPMEDLMLHDGEKVKALQLPYRDDVQMKIAGAGGKGKGAAARVSEGNTLEIGELRIRGTRVAIIPIPPGFGAYHEGVIGAALFRHFAVSIDNDRKVLTLRRPEDYRPPAGAAVVPMTLEQGRPFVDARVRINDGEPVPVRLVVDLGASHPISINARPERGISPPERTVQTVIGRGVSGEITGRVGRVQSLQIGGLDLTQVVATFPDPDHHSPRGMDARDGNLGNGVLDRFNVTFDYAGSRMILEPTRRISEPFEWDMSGLQAEPTGEGAIRVRRVLHGTPAGEAGVREDDRIVSLDGEAVSAANWFSLRERLRRDGQSVALGLRRGEKPVEVTFKLRRLI
jgi:hypothetical protein